MHVEGHRVNPNLNLPQEPAIDAPAGLAAAAARGGAIVLGSVAVARLLNLSITIALARLLSPEEFGRFGMAMTLVGLLGVFSDLGLATAVIQKQTLDQSEASTIFWLNLLVSCALSAAVALLSPAVAAFYREPELARLTLLAGLVFPMWALGTQHHALLTRRLRFARSAACEIVGIAAGGAVGIALAARGFGVHALVAQFLAAALAGSLAGWALLGWIPSWPRRGTDVRGVLRFGGYLTASNFLAYLGRNLDNILLGRICGAGVLGLYTRAYALMMYPIAFVSGPLARVAVPTLSRLQDDPARLRAGTLRLLGAIALLSFPMVALLFAAADDAILLLYGPRWTAAAPIFRVLCIAGLFQGIYSAAGQVFISAGRTDRMFASALATTLALAAGFAIGVRWGAVGVAGAYAMVLSVVLVPYLAYAYATIGLQLRPVMQALAPPLIASMCLTGASSAATNALARDGSPALRLLVAATTGAAAYFGVLLVFWRGMLRGMLRDTIVRLAPAGRAVPPHDCNV